MRKLFTRDCVLVCSEQDRRHLNSYAKMLSHATDNDEREIRHMPLMQLHSLLESQRMPWLHCIVNGED